MPSFAGFLCHYFYNMLFVQIWIDLNISLIPNMNTGIIHIKGLWASLIILRTKHEHYSLE